MERRTFLNLMAASPLVGLLSGKIADGCVAAGEHHCFGGKVWGFLFELDDSHVKLILPPNAQIYEWSAGGAGELSLMAGPSILLQERIPEHGGIRWMACPGHEIIARAEMAIRSTGVATGMIMYRKAA